MNTAELEDSRFLKHFQEFYVEVIAQKKEIEALPQHSSMFRPDQEVLSDAATGGIAYPVYDRLLNVLKGQVPDARRHGGEYGVKFYEEAQYVMAALADDIFLHTDWPGRDEWQSNLLEYELFGTYVAGDRFFEDVERLLRDRDVSYVEMAAVYFMAISLGFRGKFWDKDDDGRLEYYRKQLFAFIFKSKPDILSNKKYLFPESYTHTQTEGAGKRLPYIRRWIGLIALLIIFFVFVSHGIWDHSISDLVDSAEKIIKAGS